MRKHISLGLILSSALALTSVAVASRGPDAPGQRAGTASDTATARHGTMTLQARPHRRTARQHQADPQQPWAQDKAQRIALRQQREAFRSMTPDQVGYQAAAARLAQAEGNAIRPGFSRGPTCGPRCMPC